MIFFSLVVVPEEETYSFKKSRVDDLPPQYGFARK